MSHKVKNTSKKCKKHLWTWFSVWLLDQLWTLRFHDSDGSCNGETVSCPHSEAPSQHGIHWNPLWCLSAVGNSRTRISHSGFIIRREVSLLVTRCAACRSATGGRRSGRSGALTRSRRSAHDWVVCIVMHNVVVGRRRRHLSYLLLLLRWHWILNEKDHVHAHRTMMRRSNPKCCSTTSVKIVCHVSPVVPGFCRLGWQSTCAFSVATQKPRSEQQLQRHVCSKLTMHSEPSGAALLVHWVKNYQHHIHVSYGWHFAKVCRLAWPLVTQSFQKQSLKCLQTPKLENVPNAPTTIPIIIPVFLPLSSSL